MANFKISQLTGATTPLAGTEVLPIVQSSTTRKVATDDLTVKNVRSNATTGILQIAGPGTGATRTMTTPDANFTVARTDAAQTFTGQQSFTNNGNENIRITDGTKSGTIQQSDAQTFFNGNIGLAASATFTWRHTSSYTQLMQLTGSTGDLSLSSGNFVPSTAGKGINFTANTPAAGMTSQLLNWYEEGTWTPALAFGGGSTGITYSARSGKYTRVGRQVTITFSLSLSSKGSSTGSATVTGIPFSAGTAGTGVMGYNLFWATYPASGIMFTATGTTISILLNNSGGVIDDTNFNNNTSINDVTITYFI